MAMHEIHVRRGTLAQACTKQVVIGRTEFFGQKGETMRIAMIGTRYVGSVSGACLADFGHDVVRIDKDTAKFRAPESGKIPIFESILPAWTKRAL
jgi:UDP-N-acetyl-D-mannosaminuronate dehydrogenase